MTAETASSLDPLLKRTLYRAQHRGTKEMDWMIGRFAAENVATLESKELALFNRLLDVDDAVLTMWLIGVDVSGVDMQIEQPAMDPDFAPLIEQIKQFHKHS